MMLNTEITIHPKLQHAGLITGKLAAMIDWYKTVLGMRLIYQSNAPTGSADPSVKAAWLSNDEANHRIAIVEIPGLTVDPEKSRHHRMHHMAFEYRILDELLGSYLRLKGLGIAPVLSVDEGSQTAFYYFDPDRNVVELNTSNYGDTWTSIEHIQTSPDFARRPVGVGVDPDKMIAAREAGARPWDL